MLRKMGLIALTAIGVSAGASSTSAQVPNNFMYGSDTLFNVTRDAVHNAGLDASIDYKGTGSSQGGKAMNQGDTATNPVIPALSQQIAPQSRFLSDAECGFNLTAPGSASNPKGQGLEIGLDAIGIYRGTLGTTPTAGCDTLRYTDAGGDGVALTGYTIDDWRDVLRLVYAGVYPTKPTGINGCLENAPPRSAKTNIIGRCDHAARKQLLGNWNKLFQEAGCAGGGCPSGLRHAWRRDDGSGTTDVFLTLLGLPQVLGSGASQNRPFCNGTDTEDLDPVRTPCDASEQVCTSVPYALRNANPEGTSATGTPTNPTVRGGDLGVVLAISMPTDTTKQFSTTACGFGRFLLAPMPAAVLANAQRCPEGQPRTLNQCRFPKTSLAAGDKFGCQAVPATVPTSFNNLPNMDGRVYNAWARNPDNGALLVLNANGVNDPRWFGGAGYKIHQSAVMGNAGAGAVTCKADDATKQIGCLVQADPCSVGYGGRAALAWAAAPNNKALNVRTPSGAGTPNNASDTAAILRLDFDQGGSGTNVCNADPAHPQPGSFGERYALARTLWLSASKGFGQTPGTLGFASISNASSASSLVANEKALMDWVVANKTVAGTGLDAILTKYDFIPVDKLRTFQCVANNSAGTPPTLINTYP